MSLPTGSEADIVSQGASLFGSGLGPLCSGFIAQNLSWRWVFYVQAIHCSFLILLVICFFKETRGSVLLSRKASVLNQWYEEREKAGFVGFDMHSEDGKKTEKQRIRWKVKSDEERESLGKMIGISLYRPFCKLIPKVCSN
jgi:MFS family permease